MRVELLPAIDSPSHRGVRILLEAVGSAGTSLPRKVLVDDGCGRWQALAAGLPVETRRRSVVATPSETSLHAAVRLGIGGATWLPASTPSLEDACEAAACDDHHELPLATWGVIETALAGADRLWGVAWPPLPFWNRQVGRTHLVRRLHRIAEILDCLPVLVPGPVLLIADPDRDRVEAACRCRAPDGDDWLPVPPSVTDLTALLRRSSPGWAEGVATALVGWTPEPGVTFPVMELPSGRAVGRWAVADDDIDTGVGWTAIPDRQRLAGTQWHLHHGGSRSIVREIEGSADIAAQDHDVIRLPGRIGADLRRGSPAGLIVERVARHENRGGRPLWVSGVDAAAVRVLLGLPGPIWVDGPGVPRD